LVQFRREISEIDWTTGLRTPISGSLPDAPRIGAALMTELAMSIELTPIGFIDLIIHGGTAGILLLVIIHLLMRPDFNALVGTGILFCVTGLFETILNTPLMVEALGRGSLVFLPFQQLHFISMWWFVLALFDDRFCWHLRCFWPPAIAAPLVLGALTATPGLAWWFNIGLVGLNGVLLALILAKAWGSRAGDLVDERRAFSLALAVSVPPFTLFVFITNLVSLSGPLNPEFCFLCGVVYFLLALGFSYWLTSLKDDLFLRSVDSVTALPDRRELSSADRLELDRVVKAMDGGLYLEPGLTIGRLGDILHVPEHRLRRLINGGLGYRNFAAFVNDYRIEEAKRRLSNPGLAREQIIQHAFSLGYASLAPFNRAFRERAGVSPTEYREAALARMEPG
jgi:AraC-like DNA-binding protein